MKLAFVVPGYPPHIGGVETLVEALCQGLVRSGHEVEIWTHRRHSLDSPGDEVAGGVRVLRFDNTRSERFPISKRLWQHVHAHAGEFDLIHAHSFHSTAALSCLVAPRDVPLVYSPHFHGGGHTTLARFAHIPYRLVVERLINRVDHFISVSAAERQLLYDRFPAAIGHTAVVHNAVDMSGLEHTEPFPDQPPTLLVLGRVEAYKNIDRVVTEFAAVTGPAQLVIVGDGPDRARISELAEQTRRADDIRLLGFIDRADVQRWLRTANGVISLSSHEAFGIVALEGVAAGAGVMLSDLPAHREVDSILPPGRSTIVGSDAGLADGFVRLLSTPNAGPTVVRDWAAVVTEHLAIYDEVLARRGS